MQTQVKFGLCLTKIDTKLFSGAPKLPLMAKVSASPKIKKLVLRLSV